MRELWGLVVTTLPSPSRPEVHRVLLDVLASRVSREQAADWASSWVDAPEPGVNDPVVWEALADLVGVDLRVSPGDHLHTESDIHAWLDRVEGAGQE